MLDYQRICENRPKGTDGDLYSIKTDDYAIRLLENEKAEMWNFTPEVIKKIGKTMEQLNIANIQPTLRDLKLKILN